MEYLITKLAASAEQLEAFEGRVNEYLVYGWSLSEITFDRRGDDVLCWAVLSVSDEVWARLKNAKK